MKIKDLVRDRSAERDNKLASLNLCDTISRAGRILGSNVAFLDSNKRMQKLRKGLYQFENGSGETDNYPSVHNLSKVWLILPFVKSK